MDQPTDILTLIFEQLEGDTRSLSNLSRTRRVWHTLCLPLLLRTVDLSCHNLGRRTEHECASLLDFSVIHADYADKYRPRDHLVSRQRAFLRLMTDRPELARYVKAFTWTLIWIDFGEDALTEIDRQTWSVFSRFNEVRRLDLASLHEIWDEPVPYIRQNPERLFPGVTDLRLVDWMHRGLVKAILNSLEAIRLHSLELDHLEDEGALPDGSPISLDLVDDYAHGDEDEPIDEALFARQEAGEACIFPGPMWLPLRLLKSRDLAELEEVRIRMGSFDSVDSRGYYSMFREIAGLVVSTRQTLKNLTIALGESPFLHCDDSALNNTCGTSRVGLKMVYRPWIFDMTTAFLHHLLPALTDYSYPSLDKVILEGFRVIETGRSTRPGRPDPTVTWEMVEKCPFVDIEELRKANVDYRHGFRGYDICLSAQEVRELVGVLERS